MCEKVFNWNNKYFIDSFCVSLYQSKKKVIKLGYIQCKDETFNNVFVIFFLDLGNRKW